MNITTENIESIVKQYVLGQLEDDQASEFETYYLSRPELVEMIDVVQKMHVGLDNAVLASQVAERPADSIAVAPSFASTVIKWIKSPIPAYGLAMGMAVAAFGPATLMTSLSNDQQIDNIQLVRLDTSSVRSTASKKAIDLSTVGNKNAAFMIRVKSVEFPSYRVQISAREGGDLLWSSDQFEFVSGSRDYLIVAPSQAALANVNIELVGINPKSGEESVPFCDYTEACF